MKVVVQKVKTAQVIVNKQVVGKIPFGLLLLVGFKKDDNRDIVLEMIQKIIHLRIFEDANMVMNKNVLEVKGSILVVSQFTLYADTKKGNRPSYHDALNASSARKLYDFFNENLQKYLPVETGIFGEMMEVSFTNLGPTTILLEK